MPNHYLQCEVVSIFFVIFCTIGISLKEVPQAILSLYMCKCMMLVSLTHCGLVMPDIIIDPGQHWFRWHQAISGTIVHHRWNLVAFAWEQLSFQSKIWNLLDRSTILAKFIYDKDGKPARPTPVLPVRVRGLALILKTGNFAGNAQVMFLLYGLEND